jgi:sugar phosphate isomerase/epimerase
MKYGLCTDMANYEELCKIGYDYIELAGTEVMAASNLTLREFRKKIQDFGVPCIGFNSYCNASLPIVGSGYRRDATAVYAEEICAKAALLGAKALGIGSPLARKLPNEYDLKLADMQAEEFLRTTAAIAKPYGITILFESLSTKMCNYMVHTPEALALVKRLQADSENVSMVLDFYHMSLMNEDITDISMVMPYVKHLHISGFDAGGNRSFLFEDQQEYYSLAISSAKKHGYDATISVEAITGNFAEDAIRSLRILQKSDPSESQN